MQSWEMQTARARFSELVKRAAQEGPQDITLHGRSVAVVISRELFDRLSGNEQSLVGFMRASPLQGRYDIEFERDHSLSREREIPLPPLRCPMAGRADRRCFPAGR